MLLKEVQSLVQDAQIKRHGTEAPTKLMSLSLDEYNTLVLFKAINEFERRLDHEATEYCLRPNTVGGSGDDTGAHAGEQKEDEDECVYAKVSNYLRLHDWYGTVERYPGSSSFRYKDRTIIFSRAEQWDADRKDRLFNLKSQGHLKAVAQARHWLFHNTNDIPDFKDVLRTMGKLLHFLRDIGRYARKCKYGTITSNWDWHEIVEPGPGTFAINAYIYIYILQR